jgi:LAS superfamily LD-carboxypeptidase LdcB
VISYPEGKSELTGYNFEPWHIRYIGIENATNLFKENYLDSGTNIYPELYLRQNY